MCLMEPEKHIVRIYIKGKREAEIPYSLYKRPKRNFLGIQVVFRMVENVAFMREWFGYHINLGVDKFFIYDNSKTEINEYDVLVTPNTTKAGFDFECMNMTKS